MTKNILLTIVLAALCLNFTNKAQAQTPENKAVDVTTKGIQIGQRIPDIPSLSKYKGKLIILDFWATWCSPCVAMIPKMEALQAQFKDQIQIIPVTYQSEKEVTTFLNELNKGKPSILPQITGDKELHKIFPHIYLPHYVWIDTHGKVAAITGMEEVKAEHIAKILSAESSTLLPQKHDMQVRHDPGKPFLINSNGGNGSNLIYHSLLTGYSEGVPGLISVLTQQGGGLKILYTNTTATELFKRAYTTYDNYYGKNRTILEVADISKLQVSLSGPALDDWLRKNGYCYELLLPPHLVSQAGNIMQEEFDRLIPQFTAKLSKKKVRCLVLVKTGGTEKFAWKSGLTKSGFSRNGFELRGQKLNILLLNLNALYLQNSALPIVDRTDYNGKVDLAVQANLGNVAELNIALKAYSLKLEEQELDLDMLIISDRKHNETK